jgi:hypothetical protein
VTASPAGGDDIALGGETIIDSDDTTRVAAVPAGTSPLSLPPAPAAGLGAQTVTDTALGKIGDMGQHARELVVHGSSDALDMNATGRSSRRSTSSSPA